MGTRRGMLWGLALVSCAVLALQIELTRVFSVTMWYHFAFLAISIAMFGMSLGAVVVFVRDDWFPADRLAARLTWFSLAFAAAVPVALMVHLWVPFTPMGNARGVFSVLGTYLALTIPFCCAGVVVALVLTRFPAWSGRLYAADLTGAAVGCLVVFVSLNVFDGPTAVAATSLLGAAAAWAFRWDRRRRIPFAGPAAATLALVALVVLSSLTGVLRIRLAKNQFGLPLPVKQGDVLLERWSPMSRLIVTRGGTGLIGWGFGRRADLDGVHHRFHYLLIDNAAGTALLEFHGDLQEVRFLKSDIANLAYHGMPRGGRVVVVGVGGGKDVLAALSFGASKVLGLEVNRQILEVTNGDFGEFTGHLDRRPEVRFVADEARSYLARTRERYDVIQASLIDSWAATAAGAFVLTENSLYTVEAWRLFFSRLTSEGVVSFSRWYVPEQPGEVLRLLSVAHAALEGTVARPNDHLFVAASAPVSVGPLGRLGVATLILSRSPLPGTARIRRYRSACEAEGFRVLFTPGQALPEPLRSRAGDGGKRSPLDLSPSTDDRPFFFNMLSPLHAFSPSIERQGITNFNIQAVRLLIYLVLVLMGMTVLFILLPVRRKLPSGAAPVHATVGGVLYFAGIGLGFMAMEIGQVERVTLYLGHPTYGLTVVLLGLLLAAGLGSWTTSRMGGLATSRRGALLGGAIFLAVLAVCVWITPAILHGAEAAALSLRLLLSLVLVGVPGFVMGMPFPLGLKLAANLLGDRLPWLWAVNMAFSVVGSVVAMIVSIGWGITTSMMCGLACYALGGWFLGQARPDPTSPGGGTRAEAVMAGS